jgi:hypothetical protein
MNTSSVSQDRYEFRWTVATLAALTCCAITLASVTVFLAADRFDYKPMASTLPQYDDELVQAFEALRSPEKQALLSNSLDGSPVSNAASSKTIERFGPSDSTIQCPDIGWPYSSDNCVWVADAPKRRRTTLLFKSPWCSGVLRHQPFRDCRPRPR